MQKRKIIAVQNKNVNNENDNKFKNTIFDGKINLKMNNIK